MILVRYESGLLKWHKLPEDFLETFDMAKLTMKRTKTTMSSTKSSRTASSKIKASLGRRAPTQMLFLDGGTLQFSVNPPTDFLGEDELQPRRVGEDRSNSRKVAAMIPKAMRTLEQQHARISSIGFPFVPESSDLTVPVQILGSDSLVAMWHLSNPNAASPRAEVHARIISPNVSSSARNGALNDLLSLLVTECLRPEAFLARVAELDVAIESFDFGQNLKMSGFSDKVSMT